MSEPAPDLLGDLVARALEAPWSTNDLQARPFWPEARDPEVLSIPTVPEERQAGLWVAPAGTPLADMGAWDFLGHVQDVQVHNRAFSAAEVAAASHPGGDAPALGGNGVDTGLAPALGGKLARRGELDRKLTSLADAVGLTRQRIGANLSASTEEFSAAMQRVTAMMAAMTGQTVEDMTRAVAMMASATSMPTAQAAEAFARLGVRRQTFTAPGTWTVPARVDRVTVMHGRPAVLYGRTASVLVIDDPLEPVVPDLRTYRRSEGFDGRTAGAIIRDLMAGVSLPEAPPVEFTVAGVRRKLPRTLRHTPISPEVVARHRVLNGLVHLDDLGPVLDAAWDRFVGGKTWRRLL